jgi:hypothetical protein
MDAVTRYRKRNGVLVPVRVKVHISVTRKRHQGRLTAG